MLSASQISFRLSTTASILAAIAAFCPHMKAQEPPQVHVGDATVTGLPSDWSHRHVIYGNPGTEQDAIKNGTHEQWLKTVNDPRYIVQNLKRGLPVQGPAAQDVEGRQRIADQERRTRGQGDGRNLRHQKPDPTSVTLDRDWSMKTGASPAASLTLACTAPTSGNPTAGSSTLIVNAGGTATLTASAPTAATETGTFTGNPTAGQTVTVGGTPVSASVSAQATGKITVAANACFHTNQGVTINSVSLTTTATAPGNNGSFVVGSNGGLTNEVVTIGGVAYNYESSLGNTGCGTTLNCLLIGATGNGVNANTENHNMSAEALARAVAGTGSCTDTNATPACFTLASGQGANAAVTATYTGNTNTVDFTGWNCAGLGTVLLSQAGGSGGETVNAPTGGTAGNTTGTTFALGTNAQTAANIFSAVTTNKATTLVTGSNGGTGIANLTAVTGGSAGNLYTLTLDGTPTGVTLSSPAFSGGTDGTNAGTSFAVDGVLADNATNLAAAIGRNVASVTATPTGAGVKVTALAAGTGGNSITTTSGATGFAWPGGTLNSGTPGTDGTSNGTNFTYWNVNTYDTPAQLATALAASINASSVNGNVTATTSGANLIIAANAGGTAGDSYTATSNFAAVPSGTLTGGLGQAVANVYPAKFSLSTATSVNCAGDYVVYPTGEAGSSTSATIIAYNNIYAGSCSAPVPTVYWAYNTGTGSVLTSPTLSFDGTKVAFIETPASGAAVLRLVKFASGNGTDYSAPFSFTSGTNSFTNPTAGEAWSACTASPCMISVPFQTAFNPDTNSSPFYDYFNDVLYVGDDNGTFHEFSGVFNGTPAEVTIGGWPVLLGGKLTSPVLDRVTGSLFVGSSNGTLYGITTPLTAPAVVQSGVIANGLGIVDSPIIDGTPAFPATPVVYVFVGDDGAGHSAVYQFTDTFTGGTGTEQSMGGTTGSAGLTVYDGDFDNVHYSGSGTTGNLYFCGGSATPANPTLYRIPVATFGSAVTTVKALTSGAAACSPATEFYNAGSATALTTLGTNVTATGNNGFLNGAITNTQATVVVYGFSLTINNGDYILVNSEYMLVDSGGGTTAFYGSTLTLTVTRGALGSTAVAHNNGTGVAGYTDTLSAGATTVNVASSTGILVGDYIQVDSEDMSVTAVPTGTSLTVTRGALGTGPGTTHANGAPVTIPALDWLFLSVSANGNDTGCPGACLYNYYITSPLAVGASSVTGQPAAGGTTGIVIDNGYTSAGASEIYYTTLSNQGCKGSNGLGTGTGGGTGGCAVQASQSLP